MYNVYVIHNTAFFLSLIQDPVWSPFNGVEKRSLTLKHSLGWVPLLLGNLRFDYFQHFLEYDFQTISYQLTVYFVKQLDWFFFCKTLFS